MIYYFAYGMLTDPHTIGFKPFVGRGELLHYELELLMFANILPSKDKSVYGAVWEITQEALTQLDLIEGYPTLYDRKLVDIRMNDFIICAEVYFLTEEARQNLIYSFPSASYVEKLRRGYTYCNIPISQIEDCSTLK